MYSTGILTTIFVHNLEDFIYKIFISFPYSELSVFRQILMPWSAEHAYLRCSAPAVPWSEILSDGIMDVQERRIIIKRPAGRDDHLSSPDATCSFPVFNSPSFLLAEAFVYA